MVGKETAYPSIGTVTWLSGTCQLWFYDTLHIVPSVHILQATIKQTLCYQNRKYNGHQMDGSFMELKI